MTDKTTTVAVICGGPSVEHEVSLWSAKNIVSACIEAGYSVRVIYVKRTGEWLLVDAVPSDVKSVVGAPVSLLPGRGLMVAEAKLEIDVIFPIIHGTGGEDGTLQGALELLGISYVGCGVLGSAIGMDKVMTKRLAEQAGIPVAKYLVATPAQRPDFASVNKTLGLPVFVKPASLGSSVGVSKVTNQAEYSRALKQIFALDNKALIEAAVKGREVECSILEGHELLISGVGEVTTTHEFYSYKAKYLDEKSVTISVPALIPSSILKIIQAYSRKIAAQCDLHGLSRVDFFYVEKTDEVILNEVNTLPGFTAMSMYPRLWAQEGYMPKKLVKTLIDNALRRKQK